MGRKRDTAEMTAKEFNDLLASAGLNLSQAAEILGVDRSTTQRWSKGKPLIGKAFAKLIRALIKPKKK